MKKLLKRLFTLLLVLSLAALFLVLTCFLTLQNTLPGLLSEGLGDATGFTVRVNGGTSCSLLGLRLTGQDLVLENPEGFPTAPLAEIRQFDADLARDGKGGLFFENLSLHVGRVTLAESASGTQNLSVFGKQAGPLASDLLDQVSGLLGQGSFPPVARGELRIDEVLLPDGTKAPGFPRRVDMSKVTTAQALFQLLARTANP